MTEKEKHAILLTALSGVLLLAALSMQLAGVSRALCVVMYLAAFAVGGFTVVRSAVKGFAQKNFFTEDTLMLAAAVGAFLIGEYPEAVFVIVFYRVGTHFEHYAVNRSRRSIKAVTEICPETARLVTEKGVEETDPDFVEVGDLIRVLPGDRVPLDGVVAEGSSTLDTSALTGESMPRPIAPGQEILSGCVNGDGALTVRVTKRFEDSTASRILELVESSYARKSRSERFITKFAKYYTPAVMGLALILAVIPPLVIRDAKWSDYIYRALSFLVVSCPCALVISVPLAFFGGMGGAAKKGILIKGGTYMEALADVRRAVFDKTGTLTEGVFAVTRVEPAADATAEQVLQYAAYAESASDHPIARSIREAYGKPVRQALVGEAVEAPGMGLIVFVHDQRVAVGNEKLMQRENVAYTPAPGGTVVYVAVDGAYLGALRISDRPKAGAKALIDGLRAQKIRTAILSGDTESAAAFAGEQLGVDDVYGGLLPADKVAKLEMLMDDGAGSVMYVGDGINDAPVLARADVGVAMGAFGSDAAVEAADVVIMTDEPEKALDAIRLSKRTMTIAKENIVLSIAVKLIILALCAFGVTGMSVAVFGDVGVMVLAVLNSFRALYIGKKEKENEKKDG